VQHGPIPQPLPRVVVTLGEDGTITATVDGKMFLARPIGRDLGGHLIDCSAERHGGEIHRDVREADWAVAQLELVGEGFIPGENVAIAVVLCQSRADRDGRAYAVVDRLAAPRGISDVILFGATSGTLVRGGRI
jgi:hypothetical protein